MITEIEDYFALGCGRCDRFATAECSVRRWVAGLQALRRICRAAGLLETVKWGHPCYMHAGRNIVLLGAFRGNYRMTFFNAALMKDPEGVLTKQGPNTAHADMICFADNDQVAAMEPQIRAYLAEAMGYAEAGIKAPKVPGALELPEVLVDALDGDPDLAEAFHTLTPGRQRSYVINMNSAKTPAKQSARIAKFRGKILAGKGANDF